MGTETMGWMRASGKSEDIGKERGVPGHTTEKYSHLGLGREGVSPKMK
jgi:hypothetical protein